MQEYLKGNYKIKQQPSAPQGDAQDKKIEQMFEEHALQKLGGSIAFIKKSTSFVWEGTPRDGTRGKPSR